MTLGELRETFKNIPDDAEIYAINPFTSHFTDDFGFTIGLHTNNIYLDVFPKHAKLNETENETE